MKRVVSTAIILLLLMPGALAQVAQQDLSLRGEMFYPQGAAADTASFTFSYQLPVFAQDQPYYEAINQYFASYAQELVSTGIAERVNALDILPAPGQPAYRVTLGCRITADTQEHLSVLLVSQEFLGNTQMERYDSVVFALDGIYAGQAVTLSQAMGLEQEDGQAEDYASGLVYGLVWQIVQYEIGAMQKAYFPDVTQEDVRRAFSPQTDFYFDGDGNFVFYIQAGTIAGEVEGMLTYPFSMAELFSAIDPN